MAGVAAVRRHGPHAVGTDFLKACERDTCGVGDHLPCLTSW
ncbi:hypothetical protein BJ970_003575 [Saccharopolyspora phatthalungensis]|uniref:Uncharacterized protein n=1 Tax=Saccharopolyspora phatthalungensis TaxID=664693 RepID=A0A840Q8H4_9PSEU|nr:hypothetical protein [Saccharopolyspora phatthalungensis]